ncbi:porin [Paraburkholderia xenovorans]
MKFNAIPLLFVLAGMTSVHAYAQSSVTLYGILDGGVTYVSNQGGSHNVMSDSGIMQANRWGLLGSEDLGGGLKAIFQLENGFSLNDGSMMSNLEFGRLAVVGFSSETYGKLTLGRQWDFMSDYLVEDTVALRGGTAYSFHLFDADRIAGERLSNAVKYMSPVIGGLTFGGMYGFSNVAGAFGGTPTAPRAVSFGAQYSHGPLVISAAYTNVNGQFGSLASITLGGNATRTMGLGARYSFTKLVVFGNATTTRVTNTPAYGNAVINNYEIGGDYSLTPSIRYSGGYTYTTFNHSDFHQFNAAIHYLLSVRTDVYLGLNFQHTDSNTGAGMFLIATPGSFAGFSSTGNQFAARVGIRHHF